MMLNEYLAALVTYLKKRGRGPRYLASEVGIDNFFLLLLLTFITFFPLVFGGITTVDDANIAINYGFTKSLIEVGKILAESQGRLTFFWNYPLLRVPYLVDNQVWYLVFKIGAFILLFASLCYAIGQIFRSTWVSLISIIFFLAFIQNGWDYNALTSYPFAFNIFAVSFLVSLGLFSTAIDRENISLAILSAVLYFLALGSESFVLYYPFYVAVLLSRTIPSESFVNRFVSGLKYLLPMTVLLVAYLMAYSFWRHAHPSGYDGNSLGGFNLLAAVKAILTLSFSALPVASLDFMSSPIQQLSIAYASGWSVIFSELRAVAFIKPIISGFLFAKLMASTHFILPKQRLLTNGIAWAFLGIFVPNLLLGVTQKYQNYVASGGHAVVYTYYSFISAVVFLFAIYCLFED